MSRLISVLTVLFLLAAAGSPVWAECTIPRSPVLLSTAMPDHLDCEYDEDSNGLDDEMEEAIARCATPEFRFDCGEPWWSLGPEEPHLVFNSYLGEIDGDDLLILIRFGAVWAWDGGFATSGEPCHDTDEHAGDTQSLIVLVWVRPSGNGWTVELESIHYNDVSYYPDGSPLALTSAEGRAIVFPSTGKHHWYPYPGEYDYSSECGENAYGNCEVRVPIPEHVPVYINSAPRTVVDHGGWASHHWSNWCYVRKLIGDFPADRSLRRIDLYDWRFPQCHFYTDGCDDQDSSPGGWFYIPYPNMPHIMDDHFMSQEVSGVFHTVLGGIDPDPDGDGIPFYMDPCPAHGSNGIDLDNDGLGSTCDPQPDVPNVYVGGGAPGYPALEIGPLAGFLNHPPVCEAGGPYVAECSGKTTRVSLNGSGSSEEDPGDTIAYEWTSSLTSATFDDRTSATPKVTVDTDAVCTLNGNVYLRVTDYGGLSALCGKPLRVQDTMPPDMACPADVSVECDQPLDPSLTGTATAGDLCDDEAPAISYADEIQDTDCGGDYAVARRWTATDTCGNSGFCDQTVQIVDTKAPVIHCNAVSTISPPDAPVAFTATAVDNCDDRTVVEVTGFDCFRFTKNGKEIDKTHSCRINITGDTITIRNSGGVGNHIRWSVQATDCSGNSSTALCGVDVVHP